MQKHSQRFLFAVAKSKESGKLNSRTTGSREGVAPWAAGSATQRAGGGPPSALAAARGRRNSAPTRARRLQPLPRARGFSGRSRRACRRPRRSRCQRRGRWRRRRGVQLVRRPLQSRRAATPAFATATAANRSDPRHALALRPRRRRCCARWKPSRRRSPSTPTLHLQALASRHIGTRWPCMNRFLAGI